MAVSTQGLYYQPASNQAPQYLSMIGQQVGQGLRERRMEKKQDEERKQFINNGAKVLQAFGVDAEMAKPVLEMSNGDINAAMQFLGQVSAQAQEQEAQQWNQRKQWLLSGDPALQRQAYQGLPADQQQLLHRETTDLWEKDAMERAKLQQAQADAQKAQVDAAMAGQPKDLPDIQKLKHLEQMVANNDPGAVAFFNDLFNLRETDAFGATTGNFRAQTVQDVREELARMKAQGAVDAPPGAQPNTPVSIDDILKQARRKMQQWQ